MPHTSYRVEKDSGIPHPKPRRIVFSPTSPVQLLLSARLTSSVTVNLFKRIRNSRHEGLPCGFFHPAWSTLSGIALYPGQLTNSNHPHRLQQIVSHPRQPHQRFPPSKRNV